MPVNPFLAPKRRPLAVGHRGVPLLHQENTLAGFRRAVALGLPAIELDVVLSADGRAVCLHDTHLARLTGTDAHVNDLTWDQLSKLRLQRTLPMGIGLDGGEVIVRYEREERIALLAEVLAEVGGAVAINVELKIGRPWWRADVGRVAAGEIVRAGLADRVIVTSFDPRKLRSTARAQPELVRGFAFDDTMLDFAGPLLDRLLDGEAEGAHHDPRPHAAGRLLLRRILDTGAVSRLAGARVVGADHTLVGPQTVARMRRRGMAIGAHTLFPIGSTTGKRLHASCADDDEVDRLVELGVDWIESDDPERLLARVGR